VAWYGLLPEGAVANTSDRALLRKAVWILLALVGDITLLRLVVIRVLVNLITSHHCGDL
jgi:hypothetical protein